MIRYALRCTNGHEFDSWFASGQAFDTLAGAGHLACPVCGATEVEKALMRPAIGTTRGDGGGDPPEAAAPVASPPLPMAMPGPRAAMMVEMLRKVREHVIANSEDVGRAFPEEARKIHYGEAEGRSIRGEASSDDAKKLAEEGIEVHPVPILPEDRN